MQKFEVRPRFELRLAVPPQTLEASLRASMEDDASSWARLPYAEFGVPHGERHTWSPRLAVCVRDPDPGDDELLLLCRFQPEAAVWTFYMALTAGLCVSACLAITWICASWIMGTSLVGPLCALAGTALLGAALFGASQLGQRKAQAQMSGLADRLWMALCDAKARASGEKPMTVDPQWTRGRPSAP
ncbi:MAG: hypothetical protein ACRBN8_24400 [Nannocystales bacterium]